MTHPTVFDPTCRAPRTLLLILLWIAAIAHDPILCLGSDHWAFRAPRTPALPKVADPFWSRNPIDRFVLARLAPLHRRPASAASRSTLIRRLSLDLVGLPPTIAEIDLRANDRSPDAHDRLVDHLLASPHFGERWALWWLDAVRYADSNGYEIDRPRSIWPYRDWVIGAFNAGLPFDQFAIEQLAGDMLPESSPEQQIATGFHRHSYLNEEGGHDWEQFRWEAIVDRVHTTATVFLGLTVACAQCHDHKFDPLTQDEYWRFFAFFNNVDEPFLEVPVETTNRRRNQILSQIRDLEATRPQAFPLPDRGPAENRPEAQRRNALIDQKFRQWHQRESADAAVWKTLEPLEYRSQMNATLSALVDGSLLATGDRPEVDSYRVVYRVPPGKIYGLLLEALPHPALPRKGPGRGSVLGDGSFALSEFQVDLLATSQGAPLALTFERPTATHHKGDRTVELSLDGDKLTSWHIQGGEGRAQWALFPSAQPVTVSRPARLVVTYLMNFVHQQTLGRFRLSVTSDPRPLRLPEHPRAILSLLAKEARIRSAKEDARLRGYFLSVTPELATLNKQIGVLRASLPTLPTTLIVAERQDRRPTFVHARGEFHRREDQVAPGVPRALHPLPASAPRNRLAMARWIASRENPLIGRVAMNQVWQQVFGRGLVSTPEDFGVQGSPPTHPALLDWLATEFVRRDWDLKSLIRRVVSSATYQQSSWISPEDFAWDPLNQWLARGPRFRVHAETIRDIALTTSGLLTRRVGGPSFFPPRPDLGKTIAYGNAEWKVSQGTDRYRRGLYIHRKRTAPHPGLASFDAPPRHTCNVRRRRSNTPLQALALLNDQTIIESARAIAWRVINEGPDTQSERVRFVFRLCTSRAPDELEHKWIREHLDRQRKRIRAGSLKAATLVGSETPVLGGSVEELAAWTVIARVLLNLDETVSKE